MNVLIYCVKYFWFYEMLFKIFVPGSLGCQILNLSSFNRYSFVRIRETVPHSDLSVLS